MSAKEALEKPLMARNAASRAVKKRAKTLKISESYSPIGWESLI